MANQWFRFKQFTIKQDRTAMKVGTDGVLLGAWANFSVSKSIFDVGSGTGLIAIMAAQRNQQAIIHGVEISEDAYSQAKDNVNMCPWKDRIEMHHADFFDFAKQTQLKFDHIVSNPPFYNTTLAPDDVCRAIARHSHSLSLAEFVTFSGSLLRKPGLISFILPAELLPGVRSCAVDNDLCISRLMYVKPIPSKRPHRILIELSNTYSKCDTNELIIEEFGRHQYSDLYKNLTRDFYL